MIVVNYSTSLGYKIVQRQRLTAEEYQAIRLSLYRSAKEKLTLKKAEATAQEIKEIFYVVVVASLMAKEHIEVIRRLRLQQIVKDYLVTIQEVTEEKIRGILQRRAEYDSRDIIESFKPILTSLEENVDNIAPDLEAIDEHLTKLQEAVKTVYLAKKGAHLVMSKLNMKINVYTHKLVDISVELSRKLKTIDDKIDTKTTEEDLNLFIEQSLQAIERRIR